jgi:hypothetical protein
MSVVSNWEAVRTQGAVVFQNKQTGEVIRPVKVAVAMSERRRKDRADSSAVVPDSETHLGRKLLVMSNADLEEKRGHLGSTRSIFDRRKFWREYKVHATTPGGSSAACLVQVATGKTICRFSPEKLRIYEENPHLQQVFANNRPFVRRGKALGAVDRVMSPDLTPRIPYSRRQGEVKTVEHWGQRKLLMSELEFLLLHGSAAKTVVYAGAAPGTHIGYLSSLFPRHKFILVDPAAFDCKPSANIEIKQEFFTDEMAAEFFGTEMLFICDIRSMDAGQKDAETEARVAVDMDWQQKWVQTMRPTASMLKLRLPYPQRNSAGGETRYLDGDILLPVWGGRTTTETRLVVTDPDSLRTYRHADYEGCMFYHNVVTRTEYFEHHITADGICHCFDCASEVYVLRSFFQQMHRLAPEAEVDRNVAEMSHEISRVCSSRGRSLLLRF